MDHWKRMITAAAALALALAIPAAAVDTETPAVTDPVATDPAAPTETVDGAAPGATEPAVPAFADVPADAYYSEAVSWAVEQGIAGGTGNNNFSPDEICTRAQVITFLYRAAGSPDVSQLTNPFEDVTTDDYFYAAAVWAAANKIAGGTSTTTFAPGATCSRSQVVTFQYRAAGSPAVELTDAFKDVHTTDYYAGAVSWAAAQGIAGGTGEGTFSPDSPCTRAQVVTFLYRAAAPSETVENSTES